MKKLFKRLLQFTVALVVLAVAAVVILPLVIDPNDYKPEIQQAVKEQTGRDLEIVGDIKLKVLPSLAFSMGTTSFSNAKNFADKPMISMEQLDIGLSLWGLFSGEMRDVKVTLQSPQIYMGKTKQGQNSWQDILDHQAAAQTAAQTKKAEPEAQEDDTAEEGGASISLASLKGIELSNATIYWDDQTTGEKTVVKGLNVEIGAFISGQPFPVTVTSKMGENGEKGSAKVTTTVTLGEDRYQLADLVAELTQKGQPETTLNANVDVDLTKQTLQVQKLAVTNGDLKLNGKVEGTNILGDMVLQADVNVADVNLREWLKSHGIEVETSKPDVLTAFSGKMALTAKVADSQRVDVKLSNTKLDTTTADGEFSLFLPKNESQPLGINAKLALGAINLDDYLPPASKNTAEKETSADAETNAAINLDFLQGLKVVANLVIADLIVGNADLNQVDANVMVKNGVLNSRLFIPETHQGKIDAKVMAKSSPKNRSRQQITVDADIDRSAKVEKPTAGLNLGLLQKSLMEEIYLAGLGSGKLKLTMKGESVKALKKSMNGSFKLGVQNGQIMGMDLLQYVRDGAKTIQQLSGDKGSDRLSHFAGQDKKDYNNIAASVSGVIRNGVLTTDDLNGMAPAMRLGGKGKINLVDMTMDYTTTLKLVETSKGQGGKEMNALDGLPIPVRCKGSLTNPACEADYEGLGKAWLAKEKDRLKAKAKDKIEEKLEEKIGGEKVKQIKGVLDAFGF